MRRTRKKGGGGEEETKHIWEKRKEMMLGSISKEVRKRKNKRAEDGSNNTCMIVHAFPLVYIAYGLKYEHVTLNRYGL